MDATAFVQESQVDKDVKELQPVMQSIQEEYPVLKSHAFHVRRGQTNEDYYSEFYAPWAEDNPAKGVPTIELYKDVKGQELKNLMLGETFHHLGSVNPETGNPVDPKWFGFKQRFLDSLTPDQIEHDVQDYTNLQEQGVQYDSLPHYYQQNRLDAYFRGGITPLNDAEREDWGRTYTPEQKQILDEAHDYLKGKK